MTANNATNHKNVSERQGSSRQATLNTTATANSQLKSPLVLRMRGSQCERLLGGCVTASVWLGGGNKAQKRAEKTWLLRKFRKCQSMWTCRALFCLMFFCFEIFARKITAKKGRVALMWKKTHTGNINTISGHEQESSSQERALF